MVTIVKYGLFSYDKLKTQISENVHKGFDWNFILSIQFLLTPVAVWTVFQTNYALSELGSSPDQSM